MSDKEKWMVSAELRESINGRKPNQVEAYEHTGMVGDKTILRLLNHLSHYYDPSAAADHYDEIEPSDLPSKVERSKLFRLLLRGEATETLSRAIHNNDPLTQSAAIGDPGSRSDISGLRAIDKLTDLIGIPAPLFYVFGEPGSGKTNVSLLMAQLWKREHPDGKIISNIRTLESADEWIPSYGRLMEIIDDQTETIDGGGITAKDSADPILFIFDEASSHASGRGKAGHQAGKKLGPMVYKIRKSKAGMIIIGHDGKDVHPSVRTLATVMQRYRGEVKKATLWEDVKDRQGRGKIMELDGIPETDYVYDDLEATAWSWDKTQYESRDDKIEAKANRKAHSIARDLADEKALEWAGKLADMEDLDTSSRIDLAAKIHESDADHSQNEISEVLDISQSAISRRLKQLKNE